MVPLLALAIGTTCHADLSLPFGSHTYSADEDSQWQLPKAAQAQGNRWYIAGPADGEGRDTWLARLRAYRQAIRTEIHRFRHVEIAYQGVRAWVRMRNDFAKALDLRPREQFRIEVEAQWVEGNNELVLALDLHDRETDAKRGWSTVFSALRLPNDGDWHRLVWEGRLPEFDHDAIWAKPIVGLDATHDPTPGRVLLRDFSFQLPQRAEKPVNDLLSAIPESAALDRSIYDRRGLRWANRAFVCHFTFMYDLSVHDPVSGRYRVDAFLDEAEQEFGGYDALVLWHAYPRIGVDERNQFDFYRDMPGGLPGLKTLVRRLHRRGVKVFIDYNPWDRGTRRETVTDEEAIAALVGAIEADGVFLDTMSAGGRELRAAVDAARRGVIFEPEGSPPIEQLEICSASWAQGARELEEPGLLRLKWIEPRHMQHQINRWAGSHERELEAAFFNGSGMLVWENIFGTWNPWHAPDRATLRRMVMILRLCPDNFSSDAWEPMVPALVEGVFANCWPAKAATVWTILNRSGRKVTEPFLRLPQEPGRAFDLWNGEELTPQPTGDEWEIRVPLGPIGCVAVVRDKGMLRQLAGGWLESQHAEATRALPDADPHITAESLINPRPVAPTAGAPADRPPPGMVLVPAGTVRMDLVHKRRECGCYPDPGTPTDRWRDFLWGSPHNGTIEHHIGPVELPAFFIDEHEVTNAQYACFLQESGYRPPERDNFVKHWGADQPPRDLADHPVVYVGLDDARAYARWAGKRLPTELEWHRAAQGDDGRQWPWGDEFEPSRCNGPSGGTTSVAAFPSGRSPFGCYNMAGNVWEWTESERSDGHTRFCIIRGGSFYRAEGSIWYVEGGPQPCTSHTKFILMHPGLDRCSTIGFRCVKDVAR